MLKSDLCDNFKLIDKCHIESNIIHPSSTGYPGLGCRGSSLSMETLETQTSISPVTLSSSSRGLPRSSQAS